MFSNIPLCFFFCTELHVAKFASLQLMSTFYSHVFLFLLFPVPELVQYVVLSRTVGQGVRVEVANGQWLGAGAASGQGSQVQADWTKGKDPQSNEVQANEEVEAKLSASLNDWLQQSFPSLQDLRLLFSFPFIFCFYFFLYPFLFLLHAFISKLQSAYNFCYIHHSVVLQPSFCFAT